MLNLCMYTPRHTYSTIPIKYHTYPLFHSMQTLKQFKDYLLLELNRSNHTAVAYCHDIQQFGEWLTGKDNLDEVDMASVTSSDIRAWLGAIAHEDSPATVRRKTQSVRSYFRWLMQQKIICRNPASDIILAKTPKRLPEFVKEQEIENILENYDPEDFHSYRAHIIMLMLYSTGLRQEELRTLTDQDISFSMQEAKVTGKRNKQRVVPLAPELIEEICKWQKIRDAKYPDLAQPKPLIAGARGAVSKKTLYDIVRNSLSSSTSIKKSPHVLRHTFATSMLNDGAALDSVKEFLGHSSLATTQIYTHLSFKELRKAYDTAHPRSLGNSGHDMQEKFNPKQ